MIQLYDSGIYLIDGKKIVSADGQGAASYDKEEGQKGTIAYKILEEHNCAEGMEQLCIRFDKLASHDITYVGIIQTARASGLEKFPVPYALTNCHNSLCAVGGTINEDDHMYGLTAAKKYGGIYVPPHQAVIHQYAREQMASCGSMILGSDSHTRYGALGTMAMGEGGPEIVKQLLNKTYDIPMPEVIAVYMDGEPARGVGPQDVALAIIKATFECGYVNNKIMEFVGPGLKNLSADFRIGIDVMTTETTCLSSIWQTDDKIEEFFVIHGRPSDYKKLEPEHVAYYDGMVYVDMSRIKPMIAMPFHPSHVYEIEEVNRNVEDVLHEVEKKASVSLDHAVEYSLRDKISDGRLRVDQGIIAGCAGGGFESICAAADIIGDRSIGNDMFSFSVYPSSTPIYMELVKNGVIARLMGAGAVVRSAFCGPCFGAGDTPANNAFSVRHTTRNFPNREGSKLQNGQISSVALMDARSVAATAANRGILTAATEMDVEYKAKKYFFDSSIYENRVFDSKGKADPEVEIRFGPNIKDWPAMSALPEHLLLKVVSEIHDPVTTTDELIPSGETSSYRSNPLGLAEFALSRKDPAYVGRAKEVHEAQKAIVSKDEHWKEKLAGLPEVMEKLEAEFSGELSCETKTPPAEKIGIGSVIYAVKPGDGSAREQAASCQKVLGGWANIAGEYATKRYRSNLINWGMLPFVTKESHDALSFKNGDYIWIPYIRRHIQDKDQEIQAYVVDEAGIRPTCLYLGRLTQPERDIIMAGCLINYYRDTK